ncbi:Bax inhibitor-1/YccA family protein [Microbacterium sp. zg.B48]|uniref:Bax inhibitor-1/YccA family protein n=1 Tax=unclassified Microbacterium TaxID=2609290 RepID=UPI00214B1F5C|nr:MULTISPECIES: Bax inhibitor-1/YccA family protein [unclassified Microbacterium]MCR2764138.1 Bax inhibitor-1/YccA family protein [Microbacterium sp. zg.B48]MCR2808995.1 Bax inhibitor-1/YccA family protein [Microbacterium sp. zg.B185]WIM20892.1 Bax inhibitor-1/YccA family protein [Microbacterium sp. zg-B185]
MALNNPAFNNPAFQDSKAVNSYPGGAQAATLGGQTQFATAQRAGTDAAAQAHLEGMYAAPPAGAIETDRMTVEDTVMKTLGLFGILVVTAVVGWVWTMAGVTAANPSPSIAPWLIGALGGFVLSMVVIFTSRKKIRPGLIMAYAALEGLFVGGISAFFEFIFPGIVLQATIATLAVVGVTLALFASGKIRASKKATKIFLIAMVGYLVFSLVNLGLMFFGATDSAFGLRSEPSFLFGIPWGVLIGVFVVIMAAYSLVLDFDSIQQGVRNGAPRKFGWLGGFGIMVTVVWLYVEILRIIAILRGSN